MLKRYFFLFKKIETLIFHLSILIYSADFLNYIREISFIKLKYLYYCPALGASEPKSTEIQT